MQSREKLTLGMDTSGSPLLLTVKKGTKSFPCAAKASNRKNYFFLPWNPCLRKLGRKWKILDKFLSSAARGVLPGFVFRSRLLL